MIKKRIDLIKFIKSIEPQDESREILKYIKHWLRDIRKEDEKDLSLFNSWLAYGYPDKQLFEIKIDLKTRKIVEVIMLQFNYTRYI